MATVEADYRAALRAALATVPELRTVQEGARDRSLARYPGALLRIGAAERYREGPDRWRLRLALTLWLRTRSRQADLTTHLGLRAAVAAAVKDEAFATVPGHLTLALEAEEVEAGREGRLFLYETKLTVRVTALRSTSL